MNDEQKYIERERERERVRLEKAKNKKQEREREKKKGRGVENKNGDKNNLKVELQNEMDFMTHSFCIIIFTAQHFNQN